MYEIICTVIIIIAFALLAEVCECLLRRLYRGKMSNEIGLTAFFTVNSGDTDIEFTLRQLLTQLKHTNGQLIKKIYIVDNGTEKENLDICRMLCSDNEIFELCTKDEVSGKVE